MCHKWLDYYLEFLLLGISSVTLPALYLRSTCALSWRHRGFISFFKVIGALYRLPSAFMRCFWSVYDHPTITVHPLSALSPELCMSRPCRPAYVTTMLRWNLQILIMQETMCYYKKNSRYNKTWWIDARLHIPVVTCCSLSITGEELDQDDNERINKFVKLCTEGYLRKENQLVRENLANKVSNTAQRYYCNINSINIIADVTNQNADCSKGRKYCYLNLLNLYFIKHRHANLMCKW